MSKFVKSQKTGEYVKIGPTDMDYNTRFAFTRKELIAERDALIRAVGNPGIKVPREAQIEFDNIINRAKVAQGLL